MTQPVHPIGTPTKGISPNVGPLATASWLVSRGLTPTEPHWSAEIWLGTSASAVIDEDTPTLLRIELFSEEWGFWLRHAGKVSWIRITDLPFVHGQDDHGLLPATPALKNFGALVRAVEARFGVRFVVQTATIRTTLLEAEPAIRAWLHAW